MDSSNIYCPKESPDESKNCIINVNNNRGGNLQSRMNLMHIYALHGFDTLSLECNYDGSTINMCYDSDIGQYPVISFSDDFEESCKIELVSGYTNWRGIGCDPSFAPVTFQRVDEAVSFGNANAKCQETYGTDLASLH